MLVRNLKGLVKSLTSVKSLFLKTVKVVGDETAELVRVVGRRCYARPEAGEGVRGAAFVARAGGNGHGECYSLQVPPAQHPLGAKKRGTHNSAQAVGGPWIQNRLGETTV